MKKKLFLFSILIFILIVLSIILYLRFAKESDSPQPTSNILSATAAGISGKVVYEYAGGIYLSELDKKDPRCLTPTGSYPRWSPDGHFVAFRRGNQIMRISVDGKEEELLAEGKNAGAVNYHPNGREVLFIDGNEVKAISLADRSVRTLASGYRFAEIDISPDGKRLVSTVLRPIRILALDLETGDKRTLVRGCSASLSPNGELVTSLNGSHTELSLRSWHTGEISAVIDSPAGQRFDNQFWSNHPDWIASQKELAKKTPGYIYIHQVSTNQPFQITFEAGADRPDLFVRNPKQ